MYIQVHVTTVLQNSYVHPTYKWLTTLCNASILYSMLTKHTNYSNVFDLPQMFYIWDWVWSVHIFGAGTGSGRKWNSRVHPEWRETTTKGGGEGHSNFSCTSYDIAYHFLWPQILNKIIGSPWVFCCKY